MDWIEFAVKIFFAVAGIAITYIVIPWLKSKRLYETVKNAVYAAQKWAENNDIDKKEYAISVLERAGVKVTPAVEDIIEAAVYELDMMLGEAGDKGGD